MVPVTVQLLKPVDEMKLELIEIRGNRVILEWTQVADVTGARPLDQASFQINANSPRLWVLDNYSVLRFRVMATINLKTHLSFWHFIKMVAEISHVWRHLVSFQIWTLINPTTLNLIWFSLPYLNLSKNSFHLSRHLVDSIFWKELSIHQNLLFKPIHQFRVTIRRQLYWQRLRGKINCYPMKLNLMKAILLFKMTNWLLKLHSLKHIKYSGQQYSQIRLHSTSNSILMHPSSGLLKNRS